MAKRTAAQKKQVRRYYNWSKYLRLVELLVTKINEGEKPDFIVGVAAGGLFPAMVVAKTLDIPFAAMAAYSYGRKKKKGRKGLRNQRGKLHLGRSIASTETLEGKVVLIDDVADSGVTLRECKRWLQEYYHKVVTSVRTAVIWYKPTVSCVRPDIFVRAVKPGKSGECPFIVQPFERYENGGIHLVLKNLSRKTTSPIAKQKKRAVKPARKQPSRQRSR
ncbi:MAG: phosphoribosyltransferase family protein [Patescibacteria group bacterium]|nr:phosphoribosyltransferase family protein [Patescibacteria group bacterium]